MIGRIVRESFDVLTGDVAGPMMHGLNHAPDRGGSGSTIMTPAWA